MCAFFNHCFKLEIWDPFSKLECSEKDELYLNLKNVVIKKKKIPIIVKEQNRESIFMCMCVGKGPLAHVLLVTITLFFPLLIFLYTFFLN